MPLMTEPPTNVFTHDDLDRERYIVVERPLSPKVAELLPPEEHGPVYTVWDLVRCRSALFGGHGNDRAGALRHADRINRRQGPAR